MGAAKGMPTDIVVDHNDMIERIKRALNNGEYVYAQFMLAFILQKQKNCKDDGNEIIKAIKKAVGEPAFKVSWLKKTNDRHC
jgi:hypothetical protein